MSTTLSKPSEISAEPTPSRAASGKGMWWAVGVAVLLLVGGTMALGGLFGEKQKPTDTIATAPVTREDLVVSVDQSGQLEARNKVIIRSTVRGRHEIAWIIDEGTLVQPGDVLVRLDTSGREERLIQQQQAVDSGISAEVSARVNLENTQSQSTSNIEQAELALEFAELELTKYIEGAYPQELMKAKADVEIARETFKRASNKAEWSRMLLEQGYITESEADADVAAANKAQLDLRVAQGKLEVLEAFTYLQEKRRLESDVDQKRAALQRVRKKAEADILKAQTDWKTAKSRLDLDSRELQRDMEDLKNCIMYAPVAGRVVFAPQGNRWNRGEPLGKGKEVRTDQEIIHLPESGYMDVAIKVDESQRDKVEVGMPVRISGPNLPDAGFRGTLTQIAEYLDPSGWWNNDIKVYSATVQIDDGQDVAMLRTGMNCKTRIIVARYDDALVVPLQAVTMVSDRHVVYLENQDEPQPIQIGLDNGRKVHVIDGLKQGQRVLLNPPLAPSAKAGSARPRKPKAGDGGDGGDDATTPLPPKTVDLTPQQQRERLAQTLKQMHAAGMIERMDVDQATRAKLIQAAEDAEAGRPIPLDAAAIQTFRETLRQRAQAQTPQATPASNGRSTQ